MTLWRRLLHWAVIAVASGLFFIFCIYIFIPVSGIDEQISEAISPYSLTLQPGARKSLLPGLCWDSPRISSSQGPLFYFDRISIRPLLWPLFAGRLEIGASAVVGEGTLQSIRGVKGSDVFDVNASGIKLSSIPFFKTVLGADVSGILWCEGRLTGRQQKMNGSIRMEINQFEFSGAKIGGLALPDAANLHAQGAIRVDNGRVHLESLSLKGEGIYMRLSGNLPGGVNALNTPLDLTMEIMPKPEFMESQKMVFFLLARYISSPGVYRIPIRGTILKPEIL